MLEPRIATKTLAAIDAAMFNDQGAKFRTLLKPLIAKMDDAYRGEGAPFRSHLGVSLIGKDCARELWYGFNWAVKPVFPAQTLRIFNRGHLEEARFLALLQLINCELWFETEDGGQFRVSHVNGHMGSSLDGVARNIPDLNPGDLAYTEFKTANHATFTKIKKNGIMAEKAQHYTQMQVCMHKASLPFGLYIVGNKNNDELYAEIIELNPEYAQSFLDRGESIVFLREAPKKLSRSKTFYKCKYCDDLPICHGTEKPEINCRTCDFSKAEVDGSWTCDKKVAAEVLDENGAPLQCIDTDGKYTGCREHVYNPNLLNVKKFVGENGVYKLDLHNGSTVNIGGIHTSSADLRLGDDYA